MREQVRKVMAACHYGRKSPPGNGIFRHRDARPKIPLSPPLVAKENWRILALLPATAMPKVYLKTYGCQMNERDSEQVARMFVDRGYTFTPQEEEADVVLINTCSVRDQAEQKALSNMTRLRKLRDERKHVVSS
jgi:hypothetical protein